MKKLLFVCLLVISLALMNLAQEQQIKSMTLAQVIEQALKNNLDLQIEMSNPEIAKALWDKNTAIFIPTLSLGIYNRASNTTPSSSIFTGADIEKADSGSLGFTLSQNLLFGGNLSSQPGQFPQLDQLAFQPDQPPLQFAARTST